MWLAAALACAPPLQELKREGLLLSLPAGEVARKEVFYPVDLKMKLKIDPDVQVGLGPCC
jgi:hypothetical protein